MKFWELNLKGIGIFKITWELEFRKLNQGIGTLEIKFWKELKILKLFEN